jgi:UDP-N-acetylmuramate dehydrogenase
MNNIINSKTKGDTRFISSVVEADLSKFCTTKIGGDIKYMFLPTNKVEILDAIVSIKMLNIPFYILGGGSNTIFNDESLNFEQAVICLKKYNFIEKIENNGHDKVILKVGAGTDLQELIDYCQENKLGGIVGLNRIPGTIGGAVVGNAGAYGYEIKNVVKNVSSINLEEYQDEYFTNRECDFAYRESFFKKRAMKYLVYEIDLELIKLNDLEFEKQKTEYNRIADIRDSVYPKGLMSPGSIFKNLIQTDLEDLEIINIENNWFQFGKLPVGKLLENSVGKGYRIGCITTRKSHANIMENIGNGTFYQVKTLLQKLKSEVKTKYNIEIEEEIRVIENFTNYLK